MAEKLGLGFCGARFYVEFVSEHIYRILELVLVIKHVDLVGFLNVKNFLTDVVHHEFGFWV